MKFSVLACEMTRLMIMIITIIRNSNSHENKRHRTEDYDDCGFWVPWVGGQMNLRFAPGVHALADTSWQTLAAVL